MATWATLIDWITGAKAEEAVVRDTAEADYLSRPLPNEHLYLWVRPIDNSRLKAQAAPEAARACTRSVAVSLLVALLLVAMLLPFAQNLLDGYKIRALAAELERLRQEQAELERQESELLSPARLAELAAMQNYLDPEPAHLVPLAPVPDAAVAMNR